MKFLYNTDGQTVKFRFAHWDQGTTVLCPWDYFQKIILALLSTPKVRSIVRDPAL